MSSSPPDPPLRDARDELLAAFRIGVDARIMSVWNAPGRSRSRGSRAGASFAARSLTTRQRALARVVGDDRLAPLVVA